MHAHALLVVSDLDRQNSKSSHSAVAAAAVASQPTSSLPVIIGFQEWKKRASGVGISDDPASLTAAGYGGTLNDKDSSEENIQAALKDYEEYKNVRSEQRQQNAEQDMESSSTAATSHAVRRTSEQEKIRTELQNHKKLGIDILHKNKASELEMVLKQRQFHKRELEDKMEKEKNINTLQKHLRVQATRLQEAEQEAERRDQMMSPGPAAPAAPPPPTPVATSSSVILSPPPPPSNSTNQANIGAASSNKPTAAFAAAAAAVASGGGGGINNPNTKKGKYRLPSSSGKGGAGFNIEITETSPSGPYPAIGNGGVNEINSFTPAASPPVDTSPEFTKIFATSGPGRANVNENKSFGKFSKSDDSKEFVSKRSPSDESVRLSSDLERWLQQPVPSRFNKNLLGGPSSARNDAAQQQQQMLSSKRISAPPGDTAVNNNEALNNHDDHMNKSSEDRSELSRMFTKIRRSKPPEDD